VTDWRAGLDEATEATTEHRVIRGLPVVVVNTRPDIDSEEALRRLDAALALIERHQPWRWRRLARDFAQIGVRRFPCRAAYFPGSRTCLIELTFAGSGRHTEAEVAASIVHEGVHARLYAVGVAGRPGNEAREERLCREAELELGLALPAELGDVVVRRARDSLALADADVAPAIDWRLANRRVAEVDRAALGAPGWLRRLFARGNQ
jgi:hypothetical protein